MVEPKTKKIAYFIAFLLPCVVLYAFFFMYPFFKGISISTTNWDGLTPKSPISLDKTEFETNILHKIKKQSDKDFLLTVYTLDEGTGRYNRLNIGGIQRNKTERILKSVKYSPEKNKFVGLQNYKDILSGKVKDTFYPRKNTEIYYNASSSLPMRIEEKRVNKEILKTISEIDRSQFLLHYELQDDFYQLKNEYNSFHIEDTMWSIPELSNGIITDSEIDAYIRNIHDVALFEDTEEKIIAQNSFLAKHQFSDTSIAILSEATNTLFELGAFKNTLSRIWTADKIQLGVVGFTLFFAFFSVISINILAFLLALVLDSGLPGQKIFRTIFFLPNVLSMIIVALIWKMLFYQILPAISGIDVWLSDASKTPWLLIIVATWQGCGYYMIVYLAGLQNIPTEIVEASLIDGASGFQRFRYITIPLIVPAITISLFLTIANALKSFDLIYAMVGPSGYATSTVPFVLDIYYEAFSHKQAGMATSKALLLFLVILLITGIQLQVMKKREVEQ